MFGIQLCLPAQMSGRAGASPATALACVACLHNNKTIVMLSIAMNGEGLLHHEVAVPELTTSLRTCAWNAVMLKLILGMGGG